MIAAAILKMIAVATFVAALGCILALCGEAVLASTFSKCLKEADHRGIADRSIRPYCPVALRVFSLASICRITVYAM
jgi:hypothetical protein